MKIKFFSPILVILMTVLSVKLWTLFNKIEAIVRDTLVYNNFEF